MIRTRTNPRWLHGFARRTIMRPQFARRAFTLVEVLIVIGILIVLAGILLPATRKAHEQARRAQCASNIRQICLAAICHAADHPQGVYIATPNNDIDTFESLYPGYVKDLRLFICPSTMNEVRDAADLRNNARGGRNGMFGHSYEVRGWAYGGVRFPDGTRFPRDTLKNLREFKNSYAGALVMDADDNTENDPNNWPSIGDNHGTSGYTVGFMDAHAEFVPPGRKLIEAYLEGYYDPRLPSQIYQQNGVIKSGNDYRYVP
jgi:type II secretory pathway pseudopilin PulG